MLELENGQFAGCIPIRGTVCTNIVQGGRTSYTVFKTTLREAVTRIQEQVFSINHKLGELKRLDDAVSGAAANKNGILMDMYLSGDLLIVPPDTAYVYIIDLLRVTGQHCGAYTNMGNGNHRVAYSEVPIPALEFQVKLYDDCWDTEHILTTDPKAIELHHLFKETEEIIKKSLQ